MCVRETVIHISEERNMKDTLSEELIAISTMLMVAHDRGEVIRLAGELNGTIQKAMEIEKLRLLVPETKKAKTLSATIKFTEKEIDMMSKTFKKEFIANGLVAHTIKRPSGKKGFYYEIRYRRNGYNITVSSTDLKKAKALFLERTAHLEAPELMGRSKLRFGTICDEWLEYKHGKIAEKTWRDYKSNAGKYFSEDFRNKPIASIRTVDVDRFMHQFDNSPRKYEDIRTVVNSVFKYARASGIIVHNPVELVPFKRAERKKRKRLTDVQLERFLRKIVDPRYDRIRHVAYLMYFFGLRPCEIDAETRIEDGFLISRNRKRKDGKIEYKKIPVSVQTQGLIDFDKPLKPLVSRKTFEKLMKEVLGDKLTSYNLRHTFASICAESVREEIVEIWLGDSPERLVGKVYVHYSDEFMKAQMQTVHFPT